jgi:AraC-like DNA-binding protein/tetratricopeptide (TPR) repeat protein
MPTERQLSKAAELARERLATDMERASDRVKPILKALDQGAQRETAMAPVLPLLPAVPQPDAEESALAEAARGPRAECSRLREKIRRKDLRTGHDPEGTPARLERVLAYVEDHFLEHSLNVGSACRQAGVPDHRIGAALRDYSKYTLDQFIDKLQIDAAEYLLVKTLIKIVTIGHRVGFRAYSTFRAAYKKWTGETPQVTRERHGIDPYAGVPFDFGNFLELKRMASGDLAPAEACTLQEGLVGLYPEVFGAAQEEPRETKPKLAIPTLDVEALERFQAEELWPKLTELPFAEQRELVLSWTFCTPATFKFLHQKAREEGRRDKKRGVEVAQLVLDSLAGNDDKVGAHFHELQVEGWSWFANAQRLDLDFSGADASFRHAECIIATYDLGEALATGIFYISKATLRLFERKYDEALALLDAALPLFENAGDVHFQVRTLLQRAAVLSYAKRLTEAEVTLCKATILLRKTPDKELSFWIAYWSVFCLMRAGEFRRAETVLESIGAEIAVIKEPIRRNQVQWTEALIDHGLRRLDAAEAKYLASWRAFEVLDEPQYAALVALDLSLLYSEINEGAKVLEIVPAICEYFETLHLYDETLAALQLLRAAIAKTEVTVEVLQALRSSLREDPLAGNR